METQEFASKGVGTAGLTLGIIGTALAGLVNGNGGNGILGNLFGGGNCQAQNNQVSSLLMEVGRLQSEKYTDQAILKQRDIEAEINERIADFSLQTEKRLAIVEAVAPLREQLIMQQLNCVANSVNALATQVANITKTVVPISAVCPQPMAQYNSWTAPTSTTTAA